MGSATQTIDPRTVTIGACVTGPALNRLSSSALNWSAISPTKLAVAKG